jgi:hypothetical protein
MSYPAPSLAQALAVLRPLQRVHETINGPRVGFLMRDATQALGSLQQASEMIAALLAEDFLNSQPVVLDDEVHTLYSVNTTALPTVH